MLELFLAGGPLMWPLLGALLLSAAVVSERVLFWSRMNRFRDAKSLNRLLESARIGDWEEASRAARGTHDPVLRTLHAGLTHRDGALTQAMAQQGAEELKTMHKRMALLDAIITGAPLVGMLGALAGIFGALQVPQSPASDSHAVITGIARALIPAIFGLGIAIFTLIFYGMFAKKSGQAREEMEKQATALEMILCKGRDEDDVRIPAFKEPEPQPLEESSELGGLSEKEKRFFLS